MEKRKAGWKQKLILLVVSSLMVVGLLGVAEVYCRLFTRINFLDNSRGLFAFGRYGTSYGNTPNFTGISFGETFYTDPDGFRYDPEFKSAAGSDAPAVLVMGDSVAFGPALKDDRTIAGDLRKRLPDRRLYNGAVIGYDTFDYRNATETIVSQHPEIKTVLLYLCLNDVNDSSAQLIRSQSVQQPADESAPLAIHVRANNYLRSRSKLYLWLKNALIDTQMVHFKNDLSYYAKGEDNVKQALQPIIDLDEELKTKGIALKVIVSPYEVQLRTGVPDEYFVPQRLTTKILTDAGVENYDALPEFQKSQRNPKSLLFLYGDPMHVSADGAAVLADFTCSKFADCRQ